MKQNKMIKRMVTGALILSAMNSMTAFAQTNTLAVCPPNIDFVTEKVVSKDSNFVVKKGVIEDIERDNGKTKIRISDGDMGIIFWIADPIFVIHEKDQSYGTLENLEKGMEISAIMKESSPMTMSIPPQTNGVIGIVVEDDEIYQSTIGIFDEFLTDAEAMLRLNIGEDTKIVDQKGSKRMYVAEDIKNTECLVIYGATTRSIPAQTTPKLVMILGEKEQKEITQVPLREKAETLGFSIVWQGVKEPVILQKQNEKIEIFMDKDIFIVNGEEKVAQCKAELKDSVLYVSSEVIEALQ